MAARDDTTDVVIVGAGLAGLSAGLRARELGLSALIVEQGSEEYVCNSMVSGGTLHVAMHSPFAAEDELAAAIRSLSYGAATDETTKMLSTQAARVAEWLRANGARWTERPPLPGDTAPKLVLEPVPASNPWLARGDGAEQLVRRLRSRYIERGGQMLFGHRAVALCVVDGEVAGIAANADAPTVELRSRAVVVADGGFQGDFDLVRRYITPDPSRVVQSNSRISGGQCLRMAKDIGAALVNLKGFYGHLLSADALHNDCLWPYPVLDPLLASGIIIDADGRRIFDEGLGGQHAANALAWEPTKAHVICSRSTWDGAISTVFPPAPNPTLIDHGGTVHFGCDATQLERAIGLMRGALAGTLDDYNAALRSGKQSQLRVPRTRAGATIFSDAHSPLLLEGPLVAVPCVPGITFTLGGPLIDGNARVLRTDGQPIDGLYAAGGAGAGCDGGDPVGYVGGLMKAGITGVVAAEHIATYARRESR